MNQTQINMTQFPQVFTTNINPELYGFQYLTADAKIVWHLECVFLQDGIQGINVVPQSIELETTEYQENEDGDRIEDKVTTQSIDLMAFELSNCRKYEIENSGISILKLEIDFEDLKISIQW